MPTYEKKEHLARWSNLPENQPILPVMEPVPYKAKGSKYGECGIRIDGSPAFVDAVLSRLKDLLEAEGEDTRLDTSRREVKAVQINGEMKCFPNKARDAEVCYIRVAMRGDEMRACNAFLSSVTGSGKYRELMERRLAKAMA